MLKELPGQARLLHADGAWLPVSGRLGTVSLITYTDGEFKPVQACIEPLDTERPLYEFRTGSYRHLYSFSDVDLYTGEGYKNTAEFYFNDVLSTAKITKQNHIRVPHNLKVFGTQTRDWHWKTAIACSMRQSKRVYIPEYLALLTEKDLRDTLAGILRESYPAILFKEKRKPRGSWRKTRYVLDGIDEDSRRLLVHLFARIGIRARRWENRALYIKDPHSRAALLHLLGRPNKYPHINHDITIDDWLWYRKPVGTDTAFRVETENVPNLCDGIFIWQ